MERFQKFIYNLYQNSFDINTKYEALVFSE